MSNIPKLRLNGARILVKEEKLSDTLTSGIVLPGRDKQQTNKGVVIAVGDGSMLENGTKIPVSVSIGETVLYSSFSGSPVKVTKNDEETYLILNERDVLCVVEED